MQESNIAKLRQIQGVCTLRALHENLKVDHKIAREIRIVKPFEVYWSDILIIHGSKYDAETVQSQ